MARARVVFLLFAAAFILCRDVKAQGSRQLPRTPNSNITTPPDVTQEDDSCIQHCDLRKMMPEADLDVILRKGSKIRSPTDVCLEYLCIDGNKGLQAIVKDCPEIVVCSDGKAPYRLPDACCFECSYLYSASKFTVAGDDFQGEGDNNITLVEVEPEFPTPVPQTWGEWSSWTECSRSCGEGRQSRTRKCLSDNQAVLDCSGDAVQIRSCNTHHCPVHGGWTRWSEWTECSTTCNDGTQTRTRSCTNPEPMYGGDDCEGEWVENRNCFLKHCPVDCVWLDWTEWGQCNRDCGNGTQHRTREKVVEQFEGRPCEGPGAESRPCNTHHCPVDGGWSIWSPWTECSVSCSNGTQTRERACDSPAPAHGGEDCEGETNQSRGCFLRHCPVPCQWEPWSEWSLCSKTCDSGTRQRSRGFTPAQHNGAACEGEAQEIESCNTQACPDPCVDNGHPCFSEAVECTKVTDTRFFCGSCPRGMTGDGITCVAVNECAEASPCFDGVSCSDYDDGFACASCPNGFTGDGVRGYDLQDARNKQVCDDINECGLSENGGCHEFRNCINTPGSYHCGPCKEGYTEDGSSGCKLSNPCLVPGYHDCAEVEYCINYEVGEYFCQCPTGFLGNGRECSPDADLDDVPDTQLTIGCDDPPCRVDNCIGIPNSGQEDTDGDGIGNVCDDDGDNDGVKDENDNCIYVTNPDQRDRDYDGYGDKCDNCFLVPNSDQRDTNGDGVGDLCDDDIDGDGKLNTVDNCPLVYNFDQMDSDRDAHGDACDNCKNNRNFDQSDKDQDGMGDVCDTDSDRDRDGIQNEYDNCLTVANSDQCDHDDDGAGDACDDDDDNDGKADSQDNCRLIPNPDQLDENSNGIGDICEEDFDGDGVNNTMDTDPENKKVQRTDFRDFLAVTIDPANRVQIKPIWRVTNNGSEVYQRVNSDPGLMIGHDSFGSVEFNGTLFVDTDNDDDYVGLVFNYQSNRRFMLVAWKRGDGQYWNRRPFRATAGPGLQVKVIKSNTGPSDQLRNALWHEGNTAQQVRTIWKDPNHQPWEHRTAYRWNLQYSSTHGCMRLRVWQGANLLADTDCLCDGAIKGGRLGLYVFSQEKVSFSNMRYSKLTGDKESELGKCRAS